jgi:beta-glucosidase
MKLIKLLGIALLASIGVEAQLQSVTIPEGMLHGARIEMGLGHTGKVEYRLNALYFDSVYVRFAILPIGDTAQLPLKSVSGDTGVIRIVKANAVERHSIFFEAAVTPNGRYRARITVNALISEKQKHIQSVLYSMTKSEKASLCGDGGPGNLYPEFTSAKAGPVPPIYMNDGPYGWNYGWGRNEEGYNATCFSSNINLACTWDTSLARLQGSTLAEEWKARGRNCLLGPGMNILYHPLCGRTAEYFAEDPYLSGRIGAAEVVGIQSKGVISTIKHFCCNSVELNRTTMSCNATSERTLQEIFLYNWIPAVREAWAVMSTYNKLNDEWTGSNKYSLTDVLRNTWGYKSYVVSDWGADYTSSNALRYGMDIGANFVPPWDCQYIGAMQSASNAIVDMHASRILYAHEMLRDKLVNPKYDINGGFTNADIESQAHKDVVRYIGTRSIVLVRNDPAPANPLLPLPATGKSIAVLSGKNANFSGKISVTLQPGIHGSSNVYPSQTAKKFFSYFDGINYYLSKSAGAGADRVIKDPAPADLDAADYILVFVGPSYEGEKDDRTSASLSGTEGEDAVAQAFGATNGINKTIVVYSGGSGSLPGQWSNARAILIAHFPGDQQGLSLADVLFGAYNPSAKLTTTFYSSKSQIPPYENTSNNKVYYPGPDSTHGYFRVDKMGMKPLFYFGHGLSYTTFKYSDIKVYPAVINPGDRVHVRATVTNLGTNPASTPDTAKEVVQLYLSMPGSARLPARVQDLRGFRIVTLSRGQSATVNFELAAEEMQVFDPGSGDYTGTGFWTIVPGAYTVRVGASAERGRDANSEVLGVFTVKNQ